VIRDVAARRRIETAARRLVVERYDWSAVAQDFEHALTRSQPLHDIKRSGDLFLKTKPLLNS
jgi:hypothetical protein